MKKCQISKFRSAVLEDIPKIMEIDHSYHTDRVWQLDIVSDERYIGVNFRENRLPRSVKVEYPRSTKLLFKDWIHRDALLVAIVDDQPAAYISIFYRPRPTFWMDYRSCCQTWHPKTGCRYWIDHGWRRLGGHARSKADDRGYAIKKPSSDQFIQKNGIRFLWV